MRYLRAVMRKYVTVCVLRLAWCYVTSHLVPSAIQAVGQLRFVLKFIILTFPCILCRYVCLLNKSHMHVCAECNRRTGIATHCLKNVGLDSIMLFNTYCSVNIGKAYG